MLHDNLDHLFMEGEGISSHIDYQAPRNVSEEFVEHLADWIHKLPPQARSQDEWRIESWREVATTDGSR